MRASKLMHDVLTHDQVLDCLTIYTQCRTRGEFHLRILDEVIAPSLAEINRRTGSSNDPRFIAYVVEGVFHKLATLADTH